MKKFFGERGFMLINVIFLVLIVSLAALILLNGAKKISDYNSALRIVAIHLAEEQFAELESLAADGNLSAGNKNFLGVGDDLKNFYDSRNDKVFVQFKVTTDVTAEENFYNAKIKVEWNFNNVNHSVELEKFISKND